MGDSFEVKPEDLPAKSCERILVVCDYCDEEYSVVWHHRMSSLNNTPVKKDCCKKCSYKKVSENNLIKYGVANVMQVPEFYDSQKESCFKTLGCENPFQSETIKEKISKTMLEKYGKESFTQTELYLEKKKETCLNRYGCDDFMRLPKYRKMFTGENSPRWKGGIHDERWDRLQPKYKEWRDSVYKRDSFICKKCNIHPKYLECHHILNWKDNVSSRYDVDNGITFCRDCHIEFHRIYGKKNNNADQLTIFLQK